MEKIVYMIVRWMITSHRPEIEMHLPIGEVALIIETANG